MRIARPFGACREGGLLGALAVSLVLAGCGSSPGATHADEATQGSAIGSPVPDLHLSALHGGPALNLSELHGKVFLLDVWASWCAPCKEELPMLDDMAGRLRSKGIEIVAVSIDDNKQDAEAFLQSRPSWSIRLAHDPEGQVPGKLQPPKMPSSYLVDREGIIREMNAGFARSDAEKIEARLIALAEGAPSDTKEKPPAQETAASTEPPPESSAAEAAPRSGPTAHGSIRRKAFCSEGRARGREDAKGRPHSLEPERAHRLREAERPETRGRDALHSGSLERRLLRRFSRCSSALRNRPP